MGDPVVVESWHVPRALSDKALRLITSLPMDEIERRLLVPVLRPIPVSERLPEPKDCDAEGRCWWGDAGDDQFVPSWRLCEQPDDTHFTHWLPAHALPLPEVNYD